MASKNNNKTNVTINKDLNNQFDPKDNNNEDLDTKAKNEEKRQTINEKRFIFWVKISAIIVCSLFLIAIFIAYMLHLILPEHKRWLTLNDISEIKSMAIAVGSGVFSSLATSYFFNSKK
ncbi:hypothetical protein R4K89_13715 [Brachyspira intermedia]|uniref:hypothetical protein n=1 Tax=Brachyspira TaxID=29521 RepID=UPI00063DC3A1|nr:hypothetical protein [Brachyspira hyodysenteriae]KLI44928.1 hypothetical protein SZ52_00225 [Brachyspira hyodysenteriae]KLI60825.1 hypothetical protein SZ44_04305 [Brachyspira hyodysenteriae]